MSDELDPALRALLDAERSAPIAGAAEAKAHMFAAISGAGAAGVGAGAASAASAAGAAGAWSTKALLWVALSAGGVGAALGSVATSALMKPVSPTSSVSVPEVASEVAPAPEPEPIHEEEAEVEEEVELTPPLPSNAPREVPRRAQTPSEMARVAVDEEEGRALEAELSTLATERALIDQALSALRANRGQNALRALMSHERRFAAGALSEERDRLSVEALVQLGRGDQARRRAQLFETRYPSSAHLQRVRSLVE